MQNSLSEIFLHSLARFRSAQDRSDLLLWASRHPLDIALSLFKTAKFITKKNPEYVLFFDENHNIKHIAIKLDEDIIDLLGTNAASRYEDSRFGDDAIKYLFVKEDRLYSTLNENNYFDDYWDDYQNLSSNIFTGICDAYKDFM